MKKKLSWIPAITLLVAMLGPIRINAQQPQHSPASQIASLATPAIVLAFRAMLGVNMISTASGSLNIDLVYINRPTKMKMVPGKPNLSQVFYRGYKYAFNAIGYLDWDSGAGL